MCSVSFSLFVFVGFEKNEKNKNVSQPGCLHQFWKIWALDILHSLKTSIQELGGGEVLYKVAYTGRLRSKGVSFYERVGVLLVKVYEREEEFLISVCKKSQKGLQMHLMPVKKSRKCSCF